MLSQARRRPVATRHAGTRWPRRRRRRRPTRRPRTPSSAAPRWIGLALLADDDELRRRRGGRPAGRSRRARPGCVSPSSSISPSTAMVRPRCRAVPDVGERLQGRAHAVGVGVVGVVDDRDAVRGARRPPSASATVAADLRGPSTTSSNGMPTSERDGGSRGRVARPGAPRPAATTTPRSSRPLRQAEAGVAVVVELDVARPARPRPSPRRT